MSKDPNVVPDLGRDPRLPTWGSDRVLDPSPGTRAEIWVRGPGRGAQGHPGAGILPFCSCLRK